MHAHHVITAGLLVGSLAVIAPACVGAESSDTEAGGANMTPSSEDTGEAGQGLGYCGCSTRSDQCWLVGGTCVVDFNNCVKTPVRGCGLLLGSPCDGECVRP